VKDYVDKVDHSHKPANTVKPTCTEKGYTVYKCECGNTENRDFVPENGHEYTEHVTPPTYTEEGYTTYICHCGHSYVDDYVDKLEYCYKLTTGVRFNLLISKTTDIVIFTNEPAPSADEVELHDFSIDRDGSVIGWYTEEYVVITPADPENEIEEVGETIETLHITTIDGSDLIANEDCADMFNKLSDIDTIEFTNFKTHLTTNMNGMFRGCSSLKTLDLSGFDVKAVEDMQEMFARCENLVTIKASNWTLAAEKVVQTYYDDAVAETGANMFFGCAKLVGGIEYNEKAVGFEMAQIHGYFTYELDEENHKCIDIQDGTITKRYCTEIGVAYKDPLDELVKWFPHKEDEIE
jgi:surface protein